MTLRGKFLVAAVPCTMLVLGIELASAVWRSFHCPGIAPTFSVPNVLYGWSHPAGQTVHAFACRGSEYEWSTWPTFNSRGLNDADSPYERTAGVKRVLVLGDSVTEALQVERRENFSERLESMIRGVEFLNAGHSGFGTDNELLFFETEGVRYKPDVVMLVFNLQNDIAENSTTLVHAMYEQGPLHPKADILVKDDGDVVIDRSAYVHAVEEWTAGWWRSSRLRSWLREHSWFGRHLDAVFVVNRAQTLRRPPEYPQELGVYRTPVTAEWMDARRTSESLLKRLRVKTEQIGARLLVVIIPSRETVAPAEWNKLALWFPALSSGQWDMEAPRTWLVSFLSLTGFSSIDVTSTFRRKQSETGRSGFFRLDPHPDRDGQEWIAEAVVPGLRDLLATIPPSSGSPVSDPR